MIRKCLTIVGARPQFIKASVVSLAIAKSQYFKEVVVHTGQHFDSNMSDVFFEEMGMNKPDYHLDINGGNHGDMTGRMLIEIEKVLLIEKPDIVMVYGDTNSTLAGALAAVKLHIPVAHVEAGLRSYNLDMPEEINRILTDRISRWLFTPTETATRHLLDEGVAPSNVFEVGDVMLDVALHYGQKVVSKSGLLGRLSIDHNIQPGSYCLATIHRAENTDHLRRLITIVESLTRFAEKMPVVWPLHPRTRAILAKQGKLDSLAKKITIIEPAGYMDMVQLEKYAALIATDSGGVQKEAFFYKVPCVTLRDETEWIELIESGWNKLAPPTDSSSLIDSLVSSIGTQGTNVSPYGHGNAAELILDRLISDFEHIIN